MKNVVVTYSKANTIPETKICNDESEAMEYIAKKNKAGITCYLYNIVSKFAVEQTIVSTPM
jgi:hypothetical protein